MLSRLRVALHLVEVGERAVHRVDVFVVRNVVAEVDLRRGETRRDPDGVHAELAAGSRASRRFR